MSHSTSSPSSPEQGWEVQPAAFELIQKILQQACDDCPWLATFQHRMLSETGTRLYDWVDHLAVPAHLLDPAESAGFDTLEKQLISCGFEKCQIPPPVAGRLTADSHDAEEYWVQNAGIFPRVVANRDVTKLRVVLKVDQVEDFLVAQQMQEAVVEGAAGSRMQKALILDNGTVEVYVVARRGWPLWKLPEDSDHSIAAALTHLQRLQTRDRGLDQQAAFSQAMTRIKAAVEDLGVDWACWLHFEVERRYWQHRNQAARVQKRRQDEIGMGWANHDHHTYRCSRLCFARVIECLELLGMRCRERFYAGQQAGWGAQVLEQSVTGIVVFADVDLQPEELSGDFAHEGLPALEHLGTVGLWCQLHGDSMIGAGLHHLECQFDFAAAREQLAASGVPSMSPFTDFDHLKQSFTEAEMWPVDPRRLESAIRSGAIDEKQAMEIREKGAVGSHLEVLERNDGFKGFNQTGISDIISKTDPRKQLQAHSGNP